MNDKVFEHKNWEKLLTSEREERLNRQKFFEISNPNNKDVWGDLGCGPGYFTIPLAENVNKVFAVDLSIEMLEVCKNRATEKQLNNIEYLVSDGTKIDLPEDSIDKILLCNVYHEFEERPKVLKEINKILKTNGFVFLIDWKYQQAEQGPPLEHRISEEDAILEFKNAGFALSEKYEIYELEYVLVFRKLNKNS